MGDNQEPAQTLHQLFFTTESDGYGGIKFTNTLNLGENEINNRIRQDLRNQINNMLLQRISNRDEINVLAQLMHKAQELGLTKNNDNAIKKVQQIVTLISNVEYRLSICRSFWSSGIRRICAKIGLMHDCMQGLSNALQECREYGIFKTLGETEDMHEDINDFVLTPLRAAQEYYYQREADARACMEAQAATQATHNKKSSDISVAEIIEALDGPIAITACVDSSDSLCDASNICFLGGKWNKVNEVIRKTLNDISLDDLLNPADTFLIKEKKEKTLEEITIN